MDLWNKSCLTNLLEIFEVVTNQIDNRKPVVLLYFDFHKIFNIQDISKQNLSVLYKE